MSGCARPCWRPCRERVSGEGQEGNGEAPPQRTVGAATAALIRHSAASGGCLQRCPSRRQLTFAGRCALNDLERMSQETLQQVDRALREPMPPLDLEATSRETLAMLSGPECRPTTTAWLHASQTLINEGYVLPSTQTGVSPNPISVASTHWYQPDFVYVFRSLGIPIWQYPAEYAFVPDDGYIFEVLPDQPSDDSSDPTHGRFARCRSARILRIFSVRKPRDR